MAGLSDSEGRRVKACRLDPALALDTLKDAEDFLHERGLLTLTSCCSLPSLFGACHEEPYKPDSRGFGRYPKTRWWWGDALGENEGITATKLHQGKSLYLSPRIRQLVDPLCRRELARAEEGAQGAQARRMVSHLESAGPSTTDDLKTELDLTTRDFQKVRRGLEARGAILSHSITVETERSSHRHTSVIVRWDQSIETPRATRKVATPRIDDIMADLMVAAVTAAILIPERQARQAFTWTASRETVERCLADGKILRMSDDVLGSPI